MTDSENAPSTRQYPGLLRRQARRLIRGDLNERMDALEAEVTELRQMNLRLAELTDVVTELLVPLSRGDRDGLDEVLARYTRELGS